MAEITIIIPVYKVEKYIRECIDSVVNQTYKDIEIILVDDGSPDNCGLICDEYAKLDSRIVVIHKKNEGVSAARNDGLKKATGKYVIFVDSDDYMEIDACEQIIQASRLNGADLIITDMTRVSKNKKEYVSFFDKEFYSNDREYLNELVKTDFSRKYCPNPSKKGIAFGYGSPCNKAVKLDLLKNANIQFDISLKGIFDDILYSAYVFSEAQSIQYIEHSVYNYRILEGSTSHSFRNDMLDINTAIFKAWDNFLKKYNISNIYDEAYYVLIIRRLKGLLGTFFFNPCNSLSDGEQLVQLKKIINSEPYFTAIHEAPFDKLINPYDQAVYLMARLNYPIGIKMIYKLFCLWKHIA